MGCSVVGGALGDHQCSPPSPNAWNAWKSTKCNDDDMGSFCSFSGTLVVECSSTIFQTDTAAVLAVLWSSHSARLDLNVESGSTCIW